MELGFAGTAPVRLAFAAGLAARPEAVSRAPAEDTEGRTVWFDAVTSARAARAGPDIVLRDGIRFEETALAPEPFARYTYRVDATHAPGLRALVEDWQVLPGASGGTRLTWAFAADGTAVFRTLLRLARPGLGRDFRAAARALDRRLGSA